MKKRKGKFVVVDGMDGVGKSVFLGTLIEEFEKTKKRIFDLHDFWKTKDCLPTFRELEGFDAIYSSEPTHYGPGKLIRQMLISKDSDVPYSTLAIAQAYALDRQVLYEGLILPALDRGQHVFQSRSVSTTLIYQKITGKKDGVGLEDIMELPGNKFALEHAPDYLIILTVEPKKILERLNGRKKDDNAIFEKLKFQGKAKKGFESDWFRQIFEERGTQVLFMDASRTIEDSKQQMRDFFKAEFGNFD